MKRSFKDKLLYLGLSYQKEIAMIVVIDLIFILGLGALYYFLNQNIILIVGVIVLIAVNYLYLTRYNSLIAIKEKEHVDELISLLSYFEIFISNKCNVYTAFNNLLPYCSSFMSEAIKIFLQAIDADKSVAPYIQFAAKFENKIVESLMLSIYQMVDNGENDKQFDQFNLLFMSISEEYHSSLIEKHKKGLESLASWPLFAAGGIIIILTLSIITILGDMINVL